MSDTWTLEAAQKAEPPELCDICHQPLCADEWANRDGGETVHMLCVKQWFRGNFGREDLR